MKMILGVISVFLITAIIVNVFKSTTIEAMTFSLVLTIYIQRF